MMGYDQSNTYRYMQHGGDPRGEDEDRLGIESPDPRGEESARLEGAGVRGGARCRGQLHYSMQYGELRPAGRAHGRLHRAGAIADSLQQRVPHAEGDRHQGGQTPGGGGRVQHTVRVGSQVAGLLHHRSERPAVAILCASIKSHGYVEYIVCYVCTIVCVCMYVM